MIDNHNLILLSGGYYRCNSIWTKAARGLDQCYKVYFPISGRAVVEMDTGRFPIEAGRIYFLSGFRLKRQQCDSQMDVYWVHFVPESLYLRYLLDQLEPIHSWPRSVSGWPLGNHEELCGMFDEPFSEQNRPRPDLSPAVTCRIQGLLLSLISHLLETLDRGTVRDFNPEYSRLKAAIEFMDNHYKQNPSLETIARQVHLAPNYFHRIFRQLFETTPFNYMLARRLNQARHLLASSALSVKQIAEEVGYENPLYFSRVFTDQLQLSPTEYRQAQQSNRQLSGRSG